MTAKSAKEKRGSSGVKLALHIVLTLLLYTVIILGTIYLTKGAYAAPGTDVMVTIRQGDTTQEIAELLEYKNVIKSKTAFFIRAKLMVNNSDPILPGVYKLNTSMNYGNIIRTITDPGASFGENSEKD